MSLELITFLYFIVMFLVLFLGLPVAFGLGGTPVIFAAIFSPRSLLAIPSAFYYTPWNSILITIPLFLLMGNLIRYSGVDCAAYNAEYKLIGHIAGILALGNAMVFSTSVSV